MEKSLLGKTGLSVTKISLGGLFLSDIGGDFGDSRQAALYALEQGVNYIDTAPGYANSEEVLGKILKQWSGKRPILSTKVGLPPPFNPKSKEAVIRSVENSLHKLGVDYLDIVMIHEPDRPLEYDWWDDKLACEGPVMDALISLKQQGKIGFIGLGGTTAHELSMVCGTGKFDVVLTAFNYSLLWREAENEIFPVAQEHQMGIVAGSPLQQGAFAKRYSKEITYGAPWITQQRREQFLALYDLLDGAGMDIVELALRFVISNPAVHCMLTGAKNRDEIEDNIKIIKRGPLTQDILRQLRLIYAMVPYRPTLEPFALPFGTVGVPVGKFR